MICALRSQPLETASGLVDCFRGGHRLVVQGERTQAPAAIILHHRKGADPRQVAAAAQRAQAGMQSGIQSGMQTGMQTGMNGDSHA
jgi:hypothetical protein